MDFCSRGFVLSCSSNVFSTTRLRRVVISADVSRVLNKTGAWTKFKVMLVAQKNLGMSYSDLR